MSTHNEITKRALRFAETFQFTNPVIIRTEPARDEFVVRYGPPDSTEYRETELHMDWGANQQEIINSYKIEERQDVEAFLKQGVDQLVVCSARDVIYHEFLGMDLDYHLATDQRVGVGRTERCS